MRRRETIETTISDLVKAFLDYDRREDEDLPPDAIEEAVKAGEISVDEMVEIFGRELRRGIE
jgi:hypothetical protein